MNNTWWVNPDQLDERQKAVIDIPLTKSHLIVGPPGSGKTNLLLLRASQMVLSGKPNILVVVFTRTLREFVVTGGHQYDFSRENILTLNTWSYQFLKEQGVPPAWDDDFDKQRRARLDQIKTIVAAKQLSAVHDAIILDEAQDYLPEELDVFFKLGKVVFAAGDGRQQIYAGMSSPADLETRFKNAVYPLKHHYRNGPKICEVADELAKPWGGYDPLKPTSNYDTANFPSSVDVHLATDLASQVAAAVKMADTQMKAYPEELIGILCPNRPTLKDVWKLIESSSIGDRAVCQSATDGYVPFQDGKSVCVCTIHGSKGLEFRAAHLVSTENIKKSSLNRSIAYTGITRAKTSLSIHHTGKLPPYLEGALVVIKPPVKQAKLNQLFGKKK